MIQERQLGEVVKIAIDPIKIEQKSVLAQMMELYLYDLSEYIGSDINDYGYYGYPWIDAYWNEKERYPFFIRVDKRLAGFVLIRSCSEYNDLPHAHNIAEFFVMKKYRKQGVGRTSAKQIWDAFPGDWEVSIQKNNLVAKSFWRNVIENYTSGHYTIFNSFKKKIEGFIFSTHKVERRKAEI